MADGKVHLPPDQRDLSMVFQDYALWPHLSARDNVAFARPTGVKLCADGSDGHHLFAADQ